MLDQQKILAIQLLVDGELSRTDIAKKVGVSRQALYNWLDNDEFKAELNRRIQDRKVLCEKIIDSKLQDAVDKLWELQLSTQNSRVKAEVLKYFIDRALGKPASKLEMNDSRENKENITDNDILANIEEYKKKKKNVS
ncbi:phBC6A51 family helix-turn-helix protein [Brassicibacter mesophilus]|uniref:phBC6A51 family helix-turn-helix protein n=1 Tax=Brassicibacter mesophilus TaxID=745119 RepID=UPI003D1AA7A2